MTESLSVCKKSTTVRMKKAARRAPRRPGAAHWLVSRCPRLGALLLAELFMAPGARRVPLRTVSAATRIPLRVGKRRLVVHTFGEGPLCLLVHGWQGGASQLALLAETVRAAGFRVALFDMPAHGEAPGQLTSAVEFVELIVGVTRALGPVHALIGHSVGGTASLVAAARGLPVAGVVAFSPPPSFDFAVRNYARAFGLAPSAKELLARRLEQRTGSRREDFDLARLQPAVPTLLVHDLLDRVVPYRHSRRLRDAWPDTQLVQTCGLGHNRVLDAEGVAQDIAAFLLALPGGGADDQQHPAPHAALAAAP
jgi:pimeloyl-ACP methyl ester carboxylesterase